MKKYEFEMQENEFWYGLATVAGVDYPFSKNTDCEYDAMGVMCSNQINPFLISNKGRALTFFKGFEKVKFKNAVIEIYAENCDIKKLGENLKEAYLSVANEFFPSNGILPPKQFFKLPQYNTWIELIYNQNQNDILEYAKSILKNGLPAGILMIDDGYTDFYGKWDFNKEKFPNAKEMIDELHSLGFIVMLWTCPFITADTPLFKDLKNKNYLLKNSDGTIAIREWWNGYSALLDLTNEEAVDWYHAQNKFLMDTYGVDGFKFDAGSPNFYRQDDITSKPTTPQNHCELWAKIGLEYEYNEYRACYKMAGTHLVQRLSDKIHSWGNNGVSSLVPNILAQGILGYAFTCPDMIGGGDYLSFIDNQTLDAELFVRYSQCAALMPMIQFSAAPWRVLNEKYANLCKKSAQIHKDYSEYIIQLAENAVNTAEPIVRYMEYEFPSQGLEEVKDQFMLGDKYLVAPVYIKNATKRNVSFPNGKWLNVATNDIVEGSKIVLVDSPLDTLLIFKRL